MIDIARVRADLPSAVTAAYLNAGTFGPLPRAALDAMREHLEGGYVWGRIGSRGMVQWGALMDGARSAFATVANASPDEIALTHCTTDGVNLVVAGLAWADGDEVVTTTHEHPGITAPLDEIARRFGVVVRVVEPTRAAIAAALGPRTRMVAISHVLWTSGEVLPVAAIADDAHAAGAVLLVDGAQSGGAIRVDVHASGADYYTFSGQKWLCGPSGTGALWVRPDRLDGLATSQPWYLSRNRAPGQPVSEWSTARRLDAGTITLTALAGAIAAIGWRGEVGWEDGFARAATLAADLREALAGLGSVVVERPASPSSLVAFGTPGREPGAVVAHAETQGVLVRQIASHGLVRASVGFWNDERDLERLVAAVA
jgi:L-cysteine/cystine lyase